MENDALRELAAAAAAADGQPPFSDQSLVDVATGARRLLTVDSVGAALITVDADPAEAELVIHPDARRQGHGQRLLSEVLASVPGTLLVWAHGDHPGARVLAERNGFQAVRTLLQLRAPVPEPEPTPPVPNAPASVGRAVGSERPFRPGVDDAAWLELNAAAFADHPEQGKLTQPDLDARMAEAWFDPADFLLLWDGEQLAAFCWLKVVDDLGEFYVVGVDPARQGQGLGHRLVQAGLDRLAARGIRTAALYVDADNEPAVNLYRRYGFTNHTIDVQYRREGAHNL
jgi:mycothiol synthase